MKNYILKLIAVTVILSLTACGRDFLTVEPSTKIPAGGPADQRLINQNVASVYQILLLDSYANGNYNSYILMGDLRSDDLFKGGGEANDQASLYRLSQLKNNPSDVPTGWWSIYYAGLARANNAIISCSQAENVPKDELIRLEAEVHTLRAYFIHNLWKMWGNIPYFEAPLSYPYLAKQYTADEIYSFILKDLDFALSTVDGVDRLPSSASGANTGRVTKPMAQMLRARTVMYQNDQTRYNQVLEDMVEIIDNPAFGLMESLEDVFVRSGEFCKESIFETNQRADGKKWGDSWIGFGTNLPAFISPSGLSGNPIFSDGWGFAPVRKEAYDMYSPDDKRRAWSINDFRSANFSPRFQNTGFFIRKYAARIGYNDVKSGDAPLNFENNLRIFRLPEAYLNAAELLVLGATSTKSKSAQEYFDVVRERAFGDKFVANQVPANLENIKMERRLEFLGEGLRYWDLVRWGDAAKVLSEKIPEFSSDRTWDATTDKYLPIPQTEIDMTKNTDFELRQNKYK